MRYKLFLASFTVLALTAFVSCGYLPTVTVEGEPGPQGEPGEAGAPGAAGTSCSVTRAVGGVLIDCGEGGREVLLDGANGANGADGRDGVNGANGTNGVNGAAGERGEKGEKGEKGDTGAPGPQGEQGEQGAAGPQGPQGAPGTPAPITAYTIVDSFDPCGDQSGFDEVLLKLADGRWLAHYASGARQFLTFIGPGNYVTTDGHNCAFTINNDGTAQ